MSPEEREQFSWLSDKDYWGIGKFLRYKGKAYHLTDFASMPRGVPKELEAWEVFHPLRSNAGIVLNSFTDTYRIGSYRLSSGRLAIKLERAWERSLA